MEEVAISWTGYSRHAVETSMLWQDYSETRGFSQFHKVLLQIDDEYCSLEAHLNDVPREPLTSTCRTHREDQPWLGQLSTAGRKLQAC